MNRVYCMVIISPAPTSMAADVFPRWRPSLIPTRRGWSYHCRKNTIRIYAIYLQHKPDERLIEAQGCRWVTRRFRSVVGNTRKVDVLFCCTQSTLLWTTCNQGIKLGLSQGRSDCKISLRKKYINKIIVNLRVHACLEKITVKELETRIGLCNRIMLAFGV